VPDGIGAAVDVRAGAGPPTRVEPASWVDPATLAGLDRSSAGGSVNTMVPGHHLRGDVTLEVVLLGQTVAGQEREIARHSLRTVFLRVPRIPVFVVRLEIVVEAVPGKGRVPVQAPDLGECEGLLEGVEEHFPVPPLAVRGWDAKEVTTPHGKGLSDAIALLRGHDAATTACLVMVGAVGTGWDDTDPGVYGQRGGGALATPVNRPATGAHELGHVLGRLHTACNQTSGVDRAYPVRPGAPPGALDDVGFRFTGQGFEALGPDDCFDYMGAGDCAPAWSSAYGWALALPAARRCTWCLRAPHGSRMLFDLEVAGAGDATLHWAHVIDAAPDAARAPESEYTIELVDRGGRTLRWRRLHALEVPEIPTAIEYPKRFVESIPWDDRAAALVVRRRGADVTSLPIGAAAPPLDEPTVEESSDGLHARLEWGPAPADALTRYMVRYTGDGGATWLALALALEDRGLDVALRGLPSGGRCGFEVTASRQGRSTTRRSAFFSRAAVPLVAGIARPRPEGEGPADLTGVETVELLGWAYSPDLPPVPGEDLTWSVHDGLGETELGAGRRLLVAASALPAGTSFIRLVVRDGPSDEVEVMRNVSDIIA
jgi:hypothetical protein